MRGLFVTGTDTGVGKTAVTAAIARLWRRQGRRFTVCKPVATGAANIGGRLVSEDALHLARAAGCEGPEAVTSTAFTFAEPAAPPVAARAAGVELQLEAIVEEVSRRVPREGAILVEGVGGLLCPLTRTHTVADLIERLGLPTLVVARRSLGTLNHTLMTVAVARRRGLRLAGVVVSETTPPSSLAESTVLDEIRQRIDIPVLGVLPYSGGENEIVGDVDWWSLTA